MADGVIEVVAQDESKAVLPGVTVTVLPDTGFTQTNVTDSNGVARFIALPPGTYTVKVELQGFATDTLQIPEKGRVKELKMFKEMHSAG